MNRGSAIPLQLTRIRVMGEAPFVVVQVPEHVALTHTLAMEVTINAVRQPMPEHNAQGERIRHIRAMLNEL